MSAPEASVTYTHTKLHRPPVPPDYVQRPRLLARLERYPQRALTLVCAPAGYGKSTVLSHWLKSCSCATAWVSLDEEDDELKSFLVYFLAAVRRIHPAALGESWSLLKAPELPPLPVLKRCLINELDAIGEPFIVVIDDYHLIHARDVHALMAGLLQHPVPGMHLALAARRDPPLPLTTMRARGRMTEIRAGDLCFSASETSAFLGQALKMPVEPRLAELLEEKTEGWVTGLRLLALSLRHRGTPDLLAQRLRENRYILDYLVSEVLAVQPPALQDFLLRTSILKRFCAALCDTLAGPGPQGAPGGMNGSEFIAAIEEANLFVIPLDSRRRWYRYHRLFRQLLKRQLQRRFEAGDIAELHDRAARWLDRNGAPGEARRHVLAAGGLTAARRKSGQAAGRLKSPLTVREREILGYMQAGLKNKEIAARLFISPETVKRHIANIYKKFNTHGRQPTLIKALHLGILNR